MSAVANRLEFAPPATPGLLRALVLAVFAHAVLVGGLTLGVQWKREAPTLSAEAELWSAVPEEAAPAPVEPPPESAPPQPAAQPAPDPEPALEPPKVDIALERDKQRLKKQKQIELEKQQEKVRLDKLKVEALKKEQADKLNKDALEKKKTEQENLRLETQRKANLARMNGLAGASGAPTASGAALQSSGPSASYAGRIRARIKPNIVFTQDIAGNPTTEIEVRTAPDGSIIGRKITQSSGVKAWDDAVLKAIDKTEMLPRDIDGRIPASMIITFRPKD
jgi:colicin import membrane protein